MLLLVRRCPTLLQGSHFVTTLFVCRMTGGTLAGSDEGLAWDWFAPDALPPDLTAYAKVWLADALPESGPLFVR